MTSRFGAKACILFEKGQFTEDKIVRRVPCVEGIYPFRDFDQDEPMTPSCNAARSVESYRHWHEKCGHISKERYKELAAIRDDVPEFDNKVMEELQCVPCITAKTKKAPISPADNNAQPYTEVHVDLSGLMDPRIGENIYAVHFLEPHTAKTDVIMIKAKSQIAQIVSYYIATVENHFSTETYKIKIIRYDRTNENFSNELVDFCKTRGIEMHPSPPYAPESNGLIERTVQENWNRARALQHATNLPK